MRKYLLIAALVFLPQFALAGSQSYTTPGSYSFTVPSYGSLTVSVIGAGGGGGGGGVCYYYPSGPAQDTGGSGGYSAFGSVVAYGGGGGVGGAFRSNPAANGSPGAPGSASGGDANYTGAGAAGGVGGAYACTVAGYAGNGGPGGAGGEAVKTYAAGALTPGSSVSIVVGSGGTGGPGGLANGNPAGNGGTGGPGGTGYVSISWTTGVPSCTVTISPNPSAYAYTGTPVTVSWSSVNATQVFINNIGWVNPSGSTQVASQATTDYSCYGYSSTYGNGPWNSATLTVTPPSTPATTLTASPSSVNTGQSTTISATFAAGSGDLLTADNIDSPLGTGLGADTNPGPKSITFSTATPGTYTFYAMAQTNYYTSWASYKSVSVTVSATPQCTISLNPTTIQKGQSATLSYSSSYASAFSINNVGSETPNTSGQITVSPAQSTDYTGTVSTTTTVVQYGTSKTIYLTSGSSWQVPSDWNNSNNSIQAIGAGGDGAVGYQCGGGAGGGGAYSAASNVTLAPNSIISYTVGAAAGSGGYGGTGGSTWFKDSSGAFVVLAQGGAGGVNDTVGSSCVVHAGGAGGQAGSGIGATRYSGGTGGSSAMGGGGGGGAAGPNGPGASGGSYGGGNYSGGAGGGGADGGTVGANTSDAAAGGTGGNGYLGYGGAASSNTSCPSGTAGGGGSGGWASACGGGQGGSDNALGSYGAGGGGGGGGAGSVWPSQSTGRPGGPGGAYGGGGGGGDTLNAVGGAGANGIIAITYVPITYTTTTTTNSCVASGTTPPGTLTVTCSPAYSCNGNTIQYTNSSCQVSNVQACAAPAFCQTGSSSCQYPVITFNPSGNLTGNLQLTPTIVHLGGTTQVSWNASNAQSCTVTGSNGDSWTGLTGSHTSSAINSQVTYTLSCLGIGTSPNVIQKQSVTITPIFQEQ